MESPYKRQKIVSQVGAGPASKSQAIHNDRNSRRNEDDSPHSKHILPGFEPWILVRTKFRRRFVHNTQTKESYWRIPQNVLPGVITFERVEREQAARRERPEGSESTSNQHNDGAAAHSARAPAASDGSGRRRRSESLQREDEAAMLAELAAQARDTGDQNGQSEQAPAGRSDIKVGYDSEGSYEEIEVTDSEWEEDDDDPQQATFEQRTLATSEQDEPPDDGPVEFGEDDIAWQLAAMGEDHGLDPGEYGSLDEDGEAGEEGLPFTEQDAVNLFRDLLDDSRISPFTPWEKVISNESETGIVHDDRYTILPTMRARKDAWDAWVKDKAAQIKQQREAMEKRDPRIAYLAFLHDKATPKLYWPEFKRKYKRDAEINDRKLSDKDREKLYRDHISRLKLPESSRKADLISLLKSIPLKQLNKDTDLDALPEKLVSHLHYIGLKSAERDRVIEQHIRALPPAPEADDMTEEQLEEARQSREERQRREQAMANRERKVEEERRRIEKDVARARRDLREEERELDRAMTVRRQDSRTEARVVPVAGDT